MRFVNSSVALCLGAVLAISGCGRSGTDQPLYSSSKVEETPVSSDSRSDDTPEQVEETPKQDTGESSPPPEENLQREPLSPSVEGSSGRSTNQSSEGRQGQESLTDPSYQTSESEEESNSEQKVTSATRTTGNQQVVDQQLVEKVLEKIKTSTGNIYRSPGYYFSVDKIDEDTLQVEIRRDAPDEQAVANLVGLFQYVISTDALREKDLVTGEWQSL